MKLWIPASFVALVVLAYLLFFELDALESRGQGAFGLANAMGLVAVAVGLAAAAVILRRGTRP